MVLYCNIKDTNLETDHEILKNHKGKLLANKQLELHMQILKIALNHKYKTELDNIRVSHQLKLDYMTAYLGNERKKWSENME